MNFITFLIPCTEFSYFLMFAATVTALEVEYNKSPVKHLIKTSSATIKRKDILDQKNKMAPY